MVAAGGRDQRVESPLWRERIGDAPGAAAQGVRCRLRLLLLLGLGDSGLLLLFLLRLLSLFLLLLLHRLLLCRLLLLFGLLLSLSGGLLTVVIVIAAAADQRQPGRADSGSGGVGAGWLRSKAQVGLIFARGRGGPG